MTLVDLVFVVIPLTLTPTANAFAWYCWKSSRLHEWRGVILLVGLVATTVNVLLYYGWLICRVVLGATPEVWQLKDLLSEPGMDAAIVAFAAAALGKGCARSLLALSAVTGFLLWVSYGVL